MSKEKSRCISWLVYPYGETNPYQKLLVAVLKKSGIQVKAQPPIFETLPFHLLIISKGIDLFNLHWFGFLYEGKSNIRTVIRGIILMFIIFAIKFRGTRFILTLHNIYPHNTKINKLHSYVRNMILMCMDLIIVHSRQAMEEANEHFGLKNKYKIIMHGHYRDYYSNKVSKDDARKYLGINSDDKVVLFFGSLRPNKGLEYIFQASDDLYNNNITILMAGGGDISYINSLKYNYSKNIIFNHEFIKDDDVQYYFKSSDCMILPYNDGLTSGAAHLGLSFMIPLVSTDTIAFKHLIEKNICKSFDPKINGDMVASINLVMQWDRSYFINKCEEYLYECRWDKIANDYINAYETIA